VDERDRRSGERELPASSSAQSPCAEVPIRKKSSQERNKRARDRQWRQQHNMRKVFRLWISKPAKIRHNIAPLAFDQNGRPYAACSRAIKRHLEKYYPEIPVTRWTTKVKKDLMEAERALRLSRQAAKTRSVFQLSARFDTNTTGRTIDLPTTVPCLKKRMIHTSEPLNWKMTTPVSRLNSYCKSH
jgi:hypothetical protein